MLTEALELKKPKKKERSQVIDRGIVFVLAASILLTVFTTIVVIFVLAKESWGFFEQVPLLDFLTGTQWTPLIEPKSFGVLPLIAGTMQIVIGSLLLAAPLGVLVAVYLSQFANRRSQTFLKPILELLAGIPTVVYGYFALSFVTPLLKTIYPDLQVFNALSGAIVVGIMILPMISSLVDDAFRALPPEIREGGFALGATHYEVITQVMIPASASRIGAAMILAISRAIGETMAVTLAAGATPKLTLNPAESIQTMTAYIVQVAKGDVAHGTIEYYSAYAVGVVLFFLTFALNLAGNHILFRRRNRL